MFRWLTPEFGDRRLRQLCLQSAVVVIPGTPRSMRAMASGLAALPPAGLASALRLMVFLLVRGGGCGVSQDQVRLDSEILWARRVGWQAASR
jgi:hypothetical protein